MTKHELMFKLGFAAEIEKAQEEHPYKWHKRLAGAAVLAAGAYGAYRLLKRLKVKRPNLKSKPPKSAKNTPFVGKQPYSKTIKSTLASGMTKEYKILLDDNSPISKHMIKNINNLPGGKYWQPRFGCYHPEDITNIFPKSEIEPWMDMMVRKFPGLEITGKVGKRFESSVMHNINGSHSTADRIITEVTSKGLAHKDGQAIILAHVKTRLIKLHERGF